MLPATGSQDGDTISIRTLSGPVVVWEEACHTFDTKAGASKAQILSEIALSVKLSSGFKNVTFRLIFLFCINTVRSRWLFSLTLTKGPVDQSDKAILVPFLSLLRIVLKLCRKGSCYSHCPYFIVEYGVKNKVKFRTLPMYS